MKNMQPKGVHQCPLSGKNENLEYHRMMADDPRVYERAHESGVCDALALFEYYVAIRVFVGKGKREKAERKALYVKAFKHATETYEDETNELPYFRGMAMRRRVNGKLPPAHPTPAFMETHIQRNRPWLLK